jgi:hypothetical protein
MEDSMNPQVDPDMEKYCGVMEEIKLRVEVVQFFLAGKANALYAPTIIESASLQIRKILELIAFGSLVANKDAYTTVYAKVSKAWNAGEILSELGKVNPNFYPVPVLEVPSTRAGIERELKNRDPDYLTKTEFEEVYGRCGGVAHAANPYGKGIDFVYYHRMVPLWLVKIMNLLNTHQLRLINDPGMYIIHMTEHNDSRVRFYKFAPKTMSKRPSTSGK